MMSSIQAFDQPRLTAITYEVLEYEQVLNPPRDVDDVSMGVVLHFGNATVRIGWSIWNHPHHGVAHVHQITVGGDLTYHGPERGVFTVEATARWPGLVGKRLRRCDLAMHDTDGGPFPWACKLLFEGGLHLVIALGGIEDGSIVYMADNLVVTDSKTLASQYQPPAAWDSAWGEE